MAKRRNVSDIVRSLRELDDLLDKGWTLQGACREADISPATYYRWTRQFARADRAQVRHWKELEASTLSLRKQLVHQKQELEILEALVHELSCTSARGHRSVLPVAPDRSQPSGEASDEASVRRTPVQTSETLPEGCAGTCPRSDRNHS